MITLYRTADRTDALTISPPLLTVIVAAECRRAECFLVALPSHVSHGFNRQLEEPS